MKMKKYRVSMIKKKTIIWSLELNALNKADAYAEAKKVWKIFCNGRKAEIKIEEVKDNNG